MVFLESILIHILFILYIINYDKVTYFSFCPNGVKKMSILRPIKIIIPELLRLNAGGTKIFIKFELKRKCCELGE